jgi:hypothetical protein
VHVYCNKSTSIPLDPPLLKQEVKANGEYCMDISPVIPKICVAEVNERKYLSFLGY